LGAIKVAVKIRRPTIVSDFAADIASMKFVVGAVKLLRIKWLYWIIAPTEEFVVWTQEELDFRREAHYTVELGRNAQENQFEKVPKVFWSCTTARILTAEFLDGITLAEYLRMLDSGYSPQVAPEFDKDLFAGRLIDNFLGDAFRHGMFHADLHPGNLMILRGNVVGYIDFGISGVLSRYSRRHLIAMTLAYARGDLDKMCDAFFCISTLAKNADVEGFRGGVKKASVVWYGNGPGQTRLRKSITSIMLDLLILSKDNGVWPQRDVIKYIRSAIALDGLIKTFSPGADIGLHLEKACERHIKWDSLRALTSSDLTVGSFAATTRLARDGFLRAYAMLNHFAREKPLGAARNGDTRNLGQTHELIQLVWIMFCLSLPSLMGGRGISAYLLHPSGMLTAAALSIVLWRSLRNMRFA
jgi:ubiquinone biosynthesis protein